jgi:hypothetical protein
VTAAETRRRRGVRGVLERRASECEREEKKGFPELYTTRGRRKAKGRRDNWPAALPSMAGGQSGAIDQEGGENGRKQLELDCGESTALIG